MNKRIYVAIEVKQDPDHPDWVVPAEGDNEYSEEAVHKSRVIYADSMEVTDYENQPIKEVRFLGVSPTPETDPREAWIQECPIGTTGRSREEYRQAVQDWYRKEPKESKP